MRTVAMEISMKTKNLLSENIKEVELVPREARDDRIG